MREDERPAQYQDFKRFIGPRWTTRLRVLARNLGWVRWGNLRRVQPFSNVFGWDRGTPVDRYYADAFFEKYRAAIRGDVLEIDRSLYTERYGYALGKAHTFDIDPRCNPTYLCDLAHSENALPDEAYDCVLLPCTLSLLREIVPCLRNALRVLKPGGTILANASCLSPMDGTTRDFWHASPAGWRHLTELAWPGCEVILEPHGNCLAAAAAIMGISAEELSPEELAYDDGIYPVVTNIVCQKPEEYPRGDANRNDLCKA